MPQFHCQGIRVCWPRSLDKENKEIIRYQDNIAWKRTKLYERGIGVQRLGPQEIDGKFKGYAIVLVQQKDKLDKVYEAEWSW